MEAFWVQWRPWRGGGSANPARGTTRLVPQSGELVAWPGFEPGTFRMRLRVVLTCHRYASGDAHPVHLRCARMTRRNGRQFVDNGGSSQRSGGTQPAGHPGRAGGTEWRLRTTANGGRGNTWDCSTFTPVSLCYPKCYPTHPTASPDILKCWHKPLISLGEPGGTRTHDPKIKSLARADTDGHVSQAVIQPIGEIPGIAKRPRENA
jgi:hypothetical protein